jgi:tRNA threonylcarbamoyladenosine biosynthesis protein TsaE
MSLDLKLPDHAATEALGAALASGARAGRVIHLRGDLGAGKTTLVRGLLRALGHAGRVKSPTYTLVEPYELSSLHFYHFDFYRLKNQEEWEQAGFREYFNPQALCAVEWPERAHGLLAPPDLDIELRFEGERRFARLSAHSALGESWLSSLRSSS